jgi:ferric-dicitrate binding protein FerR (iron transport regulator)
VPAGPLERLSAGRATWLFLRKSVNLSQEEQEELLQIRQASLEIEAAYQLVQPCLQMLRERAPAASGDMAKSGRNELPPRIRIICFRGATGPGRHPCWSDVAVEQRSDGGANHTTQIAQAKHVWASKV